MGSACCVAAKDRTISTESHLEALQRNARYSPSWSFRWDNCGRVAGEDTSISWVSDGGSRNNRLDMKSGGTVDTANAWDERSPIDTSQTITRKKSPILDGHSGTSKHPLSDPPVIKGSTEVAGLESPAVCDISSIRSSPSVGSVSSLLTSPFQSQLHPTDTTPSRLAQNSPRHHLSRQASDNHIPRPKGSAFLISEEASSSVALGWSNESTMGSNCGSSDSWSVPPFSEIMAAPYWERWSFDSESVAFSREKVNKSNDGISASAFNIHSCGICSKLLTQQSSWASQKIISTNELAAVAVLICGHVYHSECLESMTPESSKYDPACPVCTFGVKQVMKLSERALKAEMEVKTRNKKKSRNRIVDGDLNNSSVFSRQKSCGYVGRGPGMISSPSTKSSLLKPFLRRHLSLGSKGSKSLSENQSYPKKGFFWFKASKE